MKITYLPLLYCLCISLNSVTQTKDNVEYHVSKDYDKDGHLVRYDSVRKSSKKCCKFGFDSHAFAFNTIPFDSLQKCLSALDDNILAFEDNSIVMQGKANADAFGFSIGGITAIAEKWEHHLNDSIVIVRLEKAKEHIEKKLKHLKKNQRKKTN